MRATEQLPDEIPIARTEHRPDELATDTLLRAAERAEVDVAAANQQTPLHAQLASDALDKLAAHHRQSAAANDFVFVVELWDRTFAVTAEAVTVFP